MHLYIWLLLIFPYLIYKTIIPIFSDTNDSESGSIGVEVYLFTIAFLLFNFYFLIQFWIIMKRHIVTHVQIGKGLLFLSSRIMIHLVARYVYNLTFILPLFYFFIFMSFNFSAPLVL